MFAIARTAARACLVLVALGLATAAPARAAQVSQDARVTMSDGVSVQTTLTGEAPLAPRPVIVEFSPYGRSSATTYDGPAYNYLLVQIRGTGDSDGQFDALGGRTQNDVAQTLAWACNQPWSNGTLGLNGFSASAIAVYNSLHLSLPCVRTAVLKSGTYELYRDLLWPGGISNALPGLGVLGLIGAPAIAQGLPRLQRNPLSSLDVALGLFNAGLNGGLLHPTLDSWWQERGFRGEAQHLPILMIDGFFDVESRGAFQAYQRLRDDGAHLIVIGAHDGSPAGTDGGKAATKAWFDRYLLGAANGIDTQPRVQLWMADGSRESYLAGKFVRYDASDWPVPGTQWNSLWLDATPSGGGNSLFGNGSLAAAEPAQSSTQSYVSVPSIPSMSDTPNTALVGGFGLNSLFSALPQLTETNLAEPLALTYTSKPLASDLVSAGPASLDLRHVERRARDRRLGRGGRRVARRQLAPRGHREAPHVLPECDRVELAAGSAGRHRPALRRLLPQEQHPGADRADLPRRVVADRQPLQAGRPDPPRDPRPRPPPRCPPASRSTPSGPAAPTDRDCCCRCCLDGRHASNPPGRRARSGSSTSRSPGSSAWRRAVGRRTCSRPWLATAGCSGAGCASRRADARRVAAPAPTASW